MDGNLEHIDCPELVKSDTTDFVCPAALQKAIWSLLYWRAFRKIDVLISPIVFKNNNNKKRGFYINPSNVDYFWIGSFKVMPVELFLQVFSFECSQHA